MSERAHASFPDTDKGKGTRRRADRFHRAGRCASPLESIRRDQYPHMTANVSISSVDLGARRIYIEDIYPLVDGGRFPVKRTVGELVEVWADIFRDGHVVLAAALLWRPESAGSWSRAPMRLVDNDRWSGSFIPPAPGRFVYAIEAWTDVFATWRRDFLAKRKAGLQVDLELQEGLALVASLKPREAAVMRLVHDALNDADAAEDGPLLSDDLALAAARIDQSDLTRSRHCPLLIDRPLARAGAWYEIMPRSQSSVPGKHGTFEDCIRRLPDIAGMGFDVLYLLPIHPIGRTNRKGRNNAVKAKPRDPGSPYAIGSHEGGHDAIHPELGTLDDFARLARAASEHGMEIALDFAVQMSLDHPWLAQHPEWFKRRADGSIQFAENPPKKYEDIVNPEFYGRGREGVWTALRDVLLFWVAQGVRIFRVDNPHTKPFPFWEWVIREVQAIEPNVIFLSEAFTRPKVMKALAKLGFNQSYTYFTWRTEKEELQAYLSEITGYPEREYFRPNFFVNTPDILPLHLQAGEPWMFKARVALAATLSGNYGVYNGFELLEHAPLPGREEYLNSEKYELKTRDWNAPGNIKEYIRRLNRFRKENAALLQTSNLRFAQVDDAQVIGYVKESVARENAVAVAVALAPEGPREFWFHFGDMEIGPEGSRQRVKYVENLVSGERRMIEWGGLRLRIDQQQDPAIFMRCHA